MKKALSLMEVMISIVLLAVVITSVLQIQQNNLYYIEKFKQSSLYNSYISFVAIVSDQKRNKTVYLDDEVPFKDDEIRRELKQVKIKIKDEEQKDITLPKNDYIQTAKIMKSTYSIDGKVTKSFYTFKLQ